MFRDETIHGEETRVAYQLMKSGEDEDAPLVWVQLAETRNKRGDLASRVVTGVLLPQFAIIPLAAAVMLLVHSVGERRRAARREASKAIDGAEPANVP